MRNGYVGRREGEVKREGRKVPWVRSKGERKGHRGNWEVKRVGNESYMGEE
jgi:hypothetical protein